MFLLFKYFCFTLFVHQIFGEFSELLTDAAIKARERPIGIIDLATCRQRVTPPSALGITWVTTQNIWCWEFVLV